MPRSVKQSREGAMQSTVTLNGQVTIPAVLRKRLGIGYRDKVTFVYTRAGGLRLLVARTRGRNPLAPRPRMHVRGDEFLRLLHAEENRRNPTTPAPFL